MASALKIIRGKPHILHHTSSAFRNADIEKNGGGILQTSATAAEAATTSERRDTEPSPVQEQPYSAFNTTQKRWIVSIGAAAGWFSTSSSFIYFPIIPFLARDLNVSVEKINLTVTSYLVASGIFPSIVGGLADVYGRRPVFIVALGTYVAINVGLALQRSFPVLVALRLLQSAAISGTFSFSYGVLGDVTTPAERGGYIALMSIFLNTPQSVAPLISGLLLIQWGWQGTFWFLVIASGTLFVTVMLFLPETCRALVGDGRGKTSWTNRVLFPLLYPPKATTTADVAEKRDTNRGRCPSPVEIITIFKNPGTALSIFSYGVFYTMYSCLQASLSTIFVQSYHVSGLVVGLSYLPFGVSSILASIFGGKLLDWEYKRVAAEVGVVLVKGRVNDMTNFPIEKARLRIAKFSVLLCVPLIVGYGWALQVKTHMAVPLVLQFFIGFSVQVNFTVLNALLVDYHTGRASTIQAANNLFRCELAAGALALLDVVLRVLRPGWCFTLIAVMHGTAFPALLVTELYGHRWRKAGKQCIGEK